MISILRINRENFQAFRGSSVKVGVYESLILMPWYVLESCLPIVAYFVPLEIETDLFSTSYSYNYRIKNIKCSNSFNSSKKVNEFFQWVLWKYHQSLFYLIENRKKFTVNCNEYAANGYYLVSNFHVTCCIPFFFFSVFPRSMPKCLIFFIFIKHLDDVHLKN